MMGFNGNTSMLYNILRSAVWFGNDNSHVIIMNYMIATAKAFFSSFIKLGLAHQ